MRKCIKLLFCLFFLVSAQLMHAGTVTLKNSSFVAETFTCNGYFEGNLDTQVLTSNGGRLVGKILCHGCATLTNAVVEGDLTVEGALQVTGSCIENLFVHGATSTVCDSYVHVLTLDEQHDGMGMQTIVLRGQTVIDVFANRMPVVVDVEGDAVEVEGVRLEAGRYLVEELAVHDAAETCTLCSGAIRGQGVIADVDVQLKNSAATVDVVVGHDQKIAPAAEASVVEVTPQADAVAAAWWMPTKRWIIPTCCVAAILCVAIMANR